MRPQFRFPFLSLLFSSLLLVCPTSGAQKEALRPEVVREINHQDPQWPTVQAHLPDPATASAAQLEMAADVLRARRFPVDALDYYGYAIKRGGNEVQLLNKMGVTQLELRNTQQARACFQRAVKLKKKNPEAWNNLGALDYLERRFGSAVSNYNRAIKIDKKSPSYHSNLGTAYFEMKDFESARKEFGIALQLDPQLFERPRMSGAGVTAHMLSPEDRARFCFEMAKLYAKNGDEANMLHSLTMASEAGFDVAAEMSMDASLSPYRKDPRVILLIQNARALRAGRNATSIAAGTLPALPAPVHD